MYLFGSSYLGGVASRIISLCFAFSKIGNAALSFPFSAGKSADCEHWQFIVLF